MDVNDVFGVRVGGIHAFSGLPLIDAFYSMGLEDVVDVPESLGHRMTWMDSRFPLKWNFTEVNESLELLLVFSFSESSKQ